MKLRSARALMTTLLLVGCDDTYFGPPTALGTDLGPGWCGVRQQLDASCVSCHSPGGGVQGGLDLETDPYGALVDVPSSLYAGQTLVVPNDSGGSFLLAKLNGTQGSGQGSAMPLTGPLPQAQLDVFAQWIDDGASDICAGTTDTGSAQCDDTNETCGVGSACGGESATMLPGADCLACHAVGHGGEGPSFTLAGTAFSDLQGTDPVAGAAIHIADADGQTLTLTTNAKGNFFTSAVVAMPFTASIEAGGTTIEMTASQTDGACNACHQCDGTAGGKLYTP